MTRAMAQAAERLKRLKSLLSDLMMIPGLSGHESRVRRHIAGQLRKLGLEGGPTGSAI